MPMQDFPPTTREDIDEFFAQVVRARLNYLLAHPSSTENQPESALAAPHPTGLISDHVLTQNRQGYDCAFCETNEEDISNKRADLEPTREDISWLDRKIRYSLAVTFAAQQHHQHSDSTTSQGWVDWYQQFFTAVVGVSVLGAGFKFSVVFNEFGSGKDPRASLAAAWMLFVVSIGIASGASLVVHLRKSQITKAMQRTITYKAGW